MGKACLTHLTLQDFDSRASGGPETQLKRFREYAFRRYAVKYWHYHAKGHLGDPDLLALTKKLFDPSKPGTFTTWTQDLQYVYKFHEDEPTPDGFLSMRASKSTYSTIVTDTPLHYAAALALPEVCKWLLDCGCEVDHMSSFGSPINHALAGLGSLITWVTQLISEGDHQRKLKVIDILLEAGADPNSKTREGLPALHYAFEDLDVILRLLQKGARCTIEGGLASMLDLVEHAEFFLNGIGRENFYDEDYAFLL